MLLHRHICTTRPIDMKAANILTLIFLVNLFLVSAAVTRTKLLAVSGLDGISSLEPSGTDGFCASFVKKQGYVCEEHRVIYLHPICFS